ncbi:MAG: hypothetical protein WAR79_14515 [Melioribacteraceae bacterium]
MNKELIEMHKDFTDAVSDSILMTEANSLIVIYEGEYSIKNETGEIKLNGKITYEWFANSGVYFYGNPLTDNVELFKQSIHKETFSVIVDRLEFGQGFITRLGFGDLTKAKIKGAISSYAILGDKSVSVEKIKFSIANLREFHGLPVKRITEKNLSTSMDRLVFEDETHKIIIDKCSDFKKRKENLEEKGGYIILYNGELTGKKAPLNHADTRDLFHCLDTFLSFLNGRRTSALLIQGVFEEQVIWTDYTDYFVDSYKSVLTWP